MEQYTEDTILEKVGQNSQGLYMRLLRWREQHIPEKSFVVMLAIVIGVASGGITSQLLLFGVSDFGHFSGRHLCALCGVRQHFTRCDACALRHCAKKE